MSKPPAFQFYVSDFLLGTARFSAEEVGAYIRLLCFQWDCGGIDERDAQQLTGVPLEKLDRVLSKFSKNGDGLYRNHRLERTRKDQIVYRNKQKTNGLKGGRPKNPTVISGLSESKPKDNPSISSSSSSSSSTTPLPSTSPKKEKTIASGKPSRVFCLLKEKFLEVVKDKGLDYYFASKDAGQLKKIEFKLQQLFKERENGNGKPPTDEKIAEAWEYLLRNTKMKFVLDNFTIPIINSKWNEIINDLKKNKNGTNSEVRAKNDERLNEMLGAK